MDTSYTNFTSSSSYKNTTNRVMITSYGDFISEGANQMEMLDVFMDADILESIVTDSNELLTSIKAEEVDISTTFGIPDGKWRSIEDIFGDDGFNRSMKKMKLKKNYIEYSEDSETFLEETVHIKFFTIHDKDKSQLDRPMYIMFQHRKSGQDGWDGIKCYRVNDDMSKFYNMLSNKTIELKSGDKTYVYTTSNCADWLLMKNDDDQDTGKFKDNMSNTDIKAVLTDKNVKVTILR